jgi:hypothetical protein
MYGATILGSVIERECELGYYGHTGRWNAWFWGSPVSLSTPHTPAGMKAVKQEKFIHSFIHSTPHNVAGMLLFS